MKPAFPFLLFLVAVFFALSATPSVAQERFNVYVGLGSYGVPIGVRYQMKQSQISLGIDPGISRRLSGYVNYLYSYNRTYSVNFGYFQHLFGHSKLSERRPWYARVTMVYHRHETNLHHDWNTHADIQFGRDFNFTRALGSSISLGPLYSFASRHVVYDSPNIKISEAPYWGLAGEVSVFYRFRRKQEKV